jgi:hypothetical protein
MTRRQLSPPSPLIHNPLPIVPAQIVYFPAIASSQLFSIRHSGVPHRGDPGIHIPETRIPGFRASPSAIPE